MNVATLNSSHALLGAQGLEADVRRKAKSVHRHTHGDTFVFTTRGFGCVAAWRLRKHMGTRERFGTCAIGVDADAAISISLVGIAAMAGRPM